MAKNDFTSKIYLASSWRNQQQEEVVAQLSAAGHQVYDFKNPSPGKTGFSWAEIDEKWQSWTPEEYRAALEHPTAVGGFRADFAAMQWADTFILLQPCGRSAHLELGWAVGERKRTCVILAPGQEPELMVKMVDKIALSVEEALKWLLETPFKCEIW
jgi:hypothetical protein